MTNAPHTFAALVLTGALLAAGLTLITPTADAVPKGYWTKCHSPKAGSKLRHHDASCRAARRVQRRFSLDDTTPDGWRCDYRVTKNYRHFSCAKQPGTALQVIAWRSPRNPALVH